MKYTTNVRLEHIAVLGGSSGLWTGWSVGRRLGESPSTSTLHVEIGVDTLEMDLEYDARRRPTVGYLVWWDGVRF